jgi:1,4-dihydroxy-2-naphthoyl-CoA hydrolase
MKIWNGDITLKMLNELNHDTLGEFFGIEFTQVGDDFIEATMTVENRHRQPFGLLHGGASVALAETVGSVASWCVVNRDLFMGVGMEINANHVKAVTKGKVKAHCKAIKVGGKVHVWDIRITDESGDLCCVCRFTCMVVARR